MVSDRTALAMRYPTVRPSWAGSSTSAARSSWPGPAAGAGRTRSRSPGRKNIVELRLSARPRRRPSDSGVGVAGTPPTGAAAGRVRISAPAASADDGRERPRTPPSTRRTGRVAAANGAASMRRCRSSDARAAGGRHCSASGARARLRPASSGDPKLRCDSWVKIAGPGAGSPGRTTSPLPAPPARRAATHRVPGSGCRCDSWPNPAPPGAAAWAALGRRDVHARMRGRAGAEDPGGPGRSPGPSAVAKRTAATGCGPAPRERRRGRRQGAVWCLTSARRCSSASSTATTTSPVVLGASTTAPRPDVVDSGHNAVRRWSPPRAQADLRCDSRTARRRHSTAAVAARATQSSATKGLRGHTRAKDSGNAIRLSANGIEFTAAQGDIALTSSAGRTISLVATQARGHGVGSVEVASPRPSTSRRRAAGPQGRARHHQLRS